MSDLFTLAPDAPRGLGRALAGGGDKVKRKAFDFYPTPPEATRAFLRAEGQAIARHVQATNARPALWEPCGYGGAIATVAAAMGWPMVASDLRADPAHDVEGRDLFDYREAPAPIAVSNPPFALARKMIIHILTRAQGVTYLALLLKTTFWNCGESAELARAGLMPNRRWDVTWRIDFLDQGNPTMDCAWYVWDMADRAPHWGLLDRDGAVRIEQGGLI